MKKLKYNLIFFVFYSGFITMRIFLFDAPAWLDVTYSVTTSLLILLMYYLYDLRKERIIKKNQP